MFCSFENAAMTSSLFLLIPVNGLIDRKIIKITSREEERTRDKNVITHAKIEK